MKYVKVIAILGLALLVSAGCSATTDDSANTNMDMNEMSNANDSVNANTSANADANANANSNANTLDTMPPQSASTVEIKDFKFAPATITVKKGTTVTWTNRDSVRHNVVAQGLNASTGPKSELLGKDQSYSFTFNTVGDYAYLCEPHPYMIGKVVVTE